MIEIIFLGHSSSVQTRHSPENGRFGHRSLNRIAPRASTSSVSLESPLSPALSSSSWSALESSGSTFDAPPPHSPCLFPTGRYNPMAPQVGRQFYFIRT